MSIPEFNTYGLLPEGIHKATIEEIEDKFCNIPDKKRRKDLWTVFKKYLENISKHDIKYEIYVDGSFVTNKEYPGDIDIVLLMDVEYNNSDWNTLINDDYIKIKFEGLQVLPAFLESYSGEMTLDFAQDVETIPNIRKGIVRVIL